MALPDGRHYIPFSNSRSKCLLENWVEERAVSDIEAQKVQKREQEVSQAKLLKEGNSDLLTTAGCSHINDLTTHNDSYRAVRGPTIRTKGSRAEERERALFELAAKQVEEELNPPEEPDEVRSVTSKDFGIDDFVPMQPAPTATHNYLTDQPVTIWTEMRDRAQGISQSKPTFDTAFRRNTAFTQPIDERWDPDQVPPYTADHVPNM